jgi:hypothetical protein
MAYLYIGQQYETQSEVEAAVTAFKSRLDNNPTDWVDVQLLGGSEADGWVVPVEKLTDAEINSVSASSHYSVSSIVGGGSYVGLTGPEVTAKVAELRTEYANYKGANVITETYAPTNEDMSGYV